MISKKDLMEERLVLAKHGNPDLFLSSNGSGTDDYFYVVFKNEVVASIYLNKKRWFIWDRQKYCRYEVPNFTDALRIIEEVLCVA